MDAAKMHEELKNLIQDESEETYTLTPKGFAWLAAYESGLICDDNEEDFDEFWDRFELSLYRHGFIVNEPDSAA